MLDDDVPLLRVVSEDQGRSLGLLLRHPSDGRKLATPVCSERRKVLIDERSAEIAAVTADEEGPALGSHAHGLVAGGVPVGEQARHGSVTEEVVVAGDLEAVMAVVDVVWVVGAACDHLFVVASCPFTGLDHDAGVGQLGQTTRVVEMQMREDHLPDLTRVEACRPEKWPGRAGPVFWQVDVKQAVEGPEACRIGGEIGMKAGIDDDEALGMLDDEHRHAVGEIADLALEEAAERRRHRPSRQHVKTDRRG